MDTAWRLFCRNGYRGIGIDLILKEAGVAKMTLYNHFSSKEELIATTLEKKGREMLALLDGRLEAAGADPSEKLAALFDWLEAWLRSDDFSGCPYLKAVGEFADEAEAPRRAAADFKHEIRARLEDQCRAAGLKDPALLARRLAMIMDGAILHSDLHHDPDFAADAKAIAATLVDAHRPA